MAEKFIKHTGLVVPLDAANVDTDAIIPKQFLQKVTRTGFDTQAWWFRWMPPMSIPMQSSRNSFCRK